MLFFSVKKRWPKGYDDAMTEIFPCKICYGCIFYWITICVNSGTHYRVSIIYINIYHLLSSIFIKAC